MEFSVATFNVYESNLPQDPVPTLERWGRDLLSRADVILLTELRSDNHAEVMAVAAGLPHVAGASADLAIVSRFPITEVDFADNMMIATVAIRGVQHRFACCHWPHRPDPWTSTAERVAAARRVREMTDGESRPTFVGGDFNTCPYPRESQECLKGLGSSEEYGVIREEFYDSYLLSNWIQRARDNRIDQIHFRGAYDVISYDRLEGSLVDPSDHPFILVRFSTAVEDNRARSGGEAQVNLVGGLWGRGQSKLVRVYMRNSGPGGWTRSGNFGLGLWQPPLLHWTPTFVPLPVDNVKPGEVAQFAFNATAPVVDGKYDFQWRMVRENGSWRWFGERSRNVSITVVESQPVVPDVIGMIPQTARRTLQQVHLRVEFIGLIPRELQHVVTQVPGAGALASPNDIVVCTVEL